MKRQTFRLGSVLRYYLLQKQRTEFELRQASRALHEIDDEILALTSAIAATAALLYGSAARERTIAGWIACYRKAENLDAQLGVARTRRAKQAEVVSGLEVQLRRWAQAEETLVSLRRDVDEANKTAAAGAQQMILDEAVLRQWLKPSDG